jgi:hypothetical protein
VANNTTMNPGVGGDSIRDIDKGGVKTPVSILDVGGAGAEALLTAGQGLMAASLPVVIASNQTAVPVSDAGGSLTVDGSVAVSGTVTVDTELPAAAALADATANPTAPLVGACEQVWNGATWDRRPGNTAGAFAQGNVASGVADAGNPLKTGGQASSSLPAAVTTGQRVNAYYETHGIQVVTSVATSIGGADNAAGSFNLYDVSGSTRGSTGAALWLLNGAGNWDRARNNNEQTVLASAARTANINSADQTNYNLRGVYVTIDITAAGTGTLTFTVKYKDSLSGKYVTLLASAAQAGTGTVTLKVYPGLTAAANLVASDALPRLWRLEVTGSDGSSWTYSCSANYLS